MQSPFEEHEPFKRVTQDATTAADRQWLRMLSCVFKETTYDQLLDAGIHRDVVREFLGVIALDRRFNGSDA